MINISVTRKFHGIVLLVKLLVLTNQQVQVKNPLIIDLAACQSTLRYKHSVLCNQDNLILSVFMLHLLSLNSEMTYFLKELPRKFILTPYCIFSTGII